ncbi:hypothetical protein [Methylococcus sp. EFPC2]|uniref:hypothetical protein n=1 Tax=Methylococcus sp. EFPC2 TaxID=2812648 RepID=UPI00196790F2|nr:hypothetical protein [Methylococcus sp. EFPC2]QSA98877.1 hypothetical protein JWZ97_08930 [Methylococcus sp. EFPC2]
MDKLGAPDLNERTAEFPFNPADYFTYVFDREIRAAGMPGGYCGFALGLAAEPDLVRLQQRLDELVARFPQAAGRIERRGKRCLWIATGRRLELERHPCPGDGTETVSALLGRPSDPETDPPMSLHWLAHETGGTLLLRWIHPLLDARGVKLVLDFLGADDTAKFRDSPPLISQKLAEWSVWQKIRLTLKAKRHNDRCNRLDSSLPTVADTGPQALRLKIRRYGEEESAHISRLAQSYMGLAGKTLYTLGCFMRAMELAGPAVAKAGYCIPYAYNLRRQNAPTPVFGNQVGCLFAQATREQVRDRDGLMRHLLIQYRQTVAEQLDLAYLPLMWLGQYLSPPRYARLLRTQRSGGELSSCWFSDVGDMRFGNSGFLGAPVEHMYHLTWMTLPPGLALLAGQMNGRITLSYNYLHPAVDEAWLDRVIPLMDAELLGKGY